MAIDRGAAFEIAERATFETLANAFMREIDAGQHPGAGTVEWRVGTEGEIVRAELSYASLCGPHRFGRLWLIRAGRTPELLAPHDAVHVLVREAYRRTRHGERSAKARERESELLLRIMLSAKAVATNVERAADTPTADDFIASEHAIVFGHTFHPTPKSMQGIAGWQRDTYAPETSRRFRLVAFAAPAELVAQDTAGRLPATNVLARIAGPETRAALRPDERLLLMHPLQAEALLLDDDVAALVDDGRLRPLGPAGPPFAATSSMRTVWSEASPFMLKFSLPVRITNSVRVNRIHELAAGVALARYFRRTRVLTALPRLRMLHDTAWTTLQLPGRPESGFETILRQNPFRGPCARNVATIAALTGEGVAGRPSLAERMVRTYATAISAPVPIAATAWFAAYLECALVPLVTLYDQTGIAIEAHQQNALIVFDRGRPKQLITRDSQGLYVATSYADRLMRTVPEAAVVEDVFYDEMEVSRRFAYYLVVNQIFGVAARLGRDRLASEEVLLAQLRQRLDRLSCELTAAGRRFCRDLLDRPTITMKANLAARLTDVDEITAGNAVPMYGEMANVLFTDRVRGVRRGRDAVPV